MLKLSWYMSASLRIFESLYKMSHSTLLKSYIGNTCNQPATCKNAKGGEEGIQEYTFVAHRKKHSHLNGKK